MDAAELTLKLLTLDEGDRSHKYQDDLGIWTNGRGHNLDAAPPCAAVVNLQSKLGLPIDDMWTPEAIELQYQHDLLANCSWLWEKPWWPAVDPMRQAALNDMAFNLGPKRAQQFTTFYGLCAVADWPAAADDLEFKTLVAKQLPKRYGRLEQILRTGAPPAGMA